MQPTWSTPRGSLAQKFDFGMSRTSTAASGFAFHGIDQSPISTSATSEPSGLGFDHGQQNPAVSRAVVPSDERFRTHASSSSGLSATWNSNVSLRSQRTVGVRRISSVFSTQATYASEPLQRNC